MDDEWIIIQKKQKKEKIIEIDKFKSLDEIKNIIIDILCNNKLFKIPSYIYIYGSRARNTSKINSDIDLMIFWKYPVPSYDDLFLYKETLKSALKLNIDFVCMYITNKIVNVYDEKTKCYYDNVIIDAKCIYPENNIKTISELIDCSIKLQKI
jgi:predicted nucleotidyltransferase